ncbi:MAG: polysaccharide deacetylase family protein, partial [Clostridia bacterium]|nr:polysaccharide deacetylase family protein [Clostridia bacterium]
MKKGVAAMLYRRLQQKRWVRLLTMLLCTALLSVGLQLSLSQGSLAVGPMLYQAPQADGTPSAGEESLPLEDTGEQLVALPPDGGLAAVATPEPVVPDPETVEPPPATEPEPEPEPDNLAPRVALTFDDGPSEKTITLLDGLKERGVQATFFLLGSKVAGREATVQRMVAEGHLVGNHSYSHPVLSKLSRDSIARQISSTADAIEQAAGVRPWLVRPPYGDAPAKVRQSLAEPLIHWSVDTRDWESRNTQSIVNLTLANTKDGDIILLHDLYDTTIEATFLIIDALKERGFEFVTVETLYAEAGQELKGGVRHYSAGPRLTREQLAALEAERAAGETAETERPTTPAPAPRPATPDPAPQPVDPVPADPVPQPETPPTPPPAEPTPEPAPLPV